LRTSISALPKPADTGAALLSECNPMLDCPIFDTKLSTGVVVVHLSCPGSDIEDQESPNGMLKDANVGVIPLLPSASRMFSCGNHCQHVNLL
jgi:hypothetical protein